MLTSQTAPRPAAAAVGVIGLGEIGQVHVAAVRKSPVARLAAVADTAAELLQPFTAEGLRAYADAAALIADPGVGTVPVCLPHDLHFPVALRHSGGQERTGGKAPRDRPRPMPAAYRRRAGQRREARRIA